MDFYQQLFNLPINFSSEWFVEFELSATARLSIADERRSTVKSSLGRGITLTFQVENIQEVWQTVRDKGGNPGAVRQHAWGAQVFYLYDPEGHRLEFWSPNAA